MAIFEIENEDELCLTLYFTLVELLEDFIRVMEKNSTTLQWDGDCVFYFYILLVFPGYYKI